MREVISQLAEQLRTGERIGREAGERVALPSAVVIAGMGGSAMGGELLRALTTTHSPVPMTRVRGFGIPSWAGTGTLVVCVSYSGSTAETLVCANRAREQGADLLTIGAGGPLGELAAEWGTPHALVPNGLQPRAALGYLFGAMAGAFGAAGLARDGIALQAADGVEPGRPGAVARAGRAAGRNGAADLRRRADGGGRLPLEDPAQRERQAAGLQPRLPRARPQRDRRVGGRRRACSRP